MSSTRALPSLNYTLRRFGSVGFTSCRRPSLSLANVALTQQYHPIKYYAPSACRAPTAPILSSVNGCQKAYISTTSPKSVFGWVQEKLADRAKTKQAAKMVDQIALMANTHRWTIKHYADEIDETLNSWKAKLPGTGSTVEMQQAKEKGLIIKTMIEQLGADVTYKEIKDLDRKQKLKLAIACKIPMDELEATFNSFQQMDIMHRILRYRKGQGTALPTDEVGLKMAMQTDGIKVMTREEKADMKKMFEQHQKNQLKRAA